MTITLSGPSRPALSGTTRQLIILLHGLGADGHDLFSLSEGIAHTLPDAAFVSPNAPFACDMAPYGYQWFSLRDWTEASMYRGICEAAPILNAFIDHQKSAHKLSDSQVALLGFSQGTMMALHIALRRPQAIAGVIGFSGAMIHPKLLSKEIQSKPPICLIHGMADPIVPFGAMALAELALKEAGVSVEAHARPGLPHGIDTEGTAIASRFLTKIFNASLKG